MSTSNDSVRPGASAGAGGGHHRGRRESSLWNRWSWQPSWPPVTLREHFTSWWRSLPPRRGPARRTRGSYWRLRWFGDTPLQYHIYITKPVPWLGAGHPTPASRRLA